MYKRGKPEAGVRPEHLLRVNDELCQEEFDVDRSAVVLHLFVKVVHPGRHGGRRDTL